MKKLLTYILLFSSCIAMSQTVISAPPITTELSDSTAVLLTENRRTFKTRLDSIRNKFQQYYDTIYSGGSEASPLQNVVEPATTYTLLEADILASKVHEFTGDNVTVTIPAITYTSPIILPMIHKGTGTITIESGTGVTFTNVTLTSKQGIAIYSSADDVWDLWRGDSSGSDNIYTSNGTIDNTLRTLSLSGSSSVLRIAGNGSLMDIGNGLFYASTTNQSYLEGGDNIMLVDNDAPILLRSNSGFQFIDDNTPSVAGQVWTATDGFGSGYWANSAGGSQDISGIAVNAADIDALESEQTTQNTAITALQTEQTSQGDDIIVLQNGATPLTIPDNYIDLAKVGTKLKNANLENIQPNGDFTTVNTGWQLPNAGSGTAAFTSDGIRVLETVVSTNSNQYRLNANITANRPNVLQNHRYVFYIDLEVNTPTPEMDTFSAGAFLLSTTPLIESENRYKVNQRHFICLPFDVTVDTYETGLGRVPYFDIDVFRDADGQQLGDYEIDILIRSFRIIDLGVEGDEFYDADPAYLGETISKIEPYWFGLSEAQLKYSNYANKSTYSERAESAVLADVSTTALKADNTTSGYEGKRLITVGHSLVSQQGWQTPLINELGMVAYAMRGTAGGTLQPNTVDGTLGMYSRDYVQSVITSSANQNLDLGVSTIGLSAFESSAIILWTGANDNIGTSGLTLPLRRDGFDRIMTIAEQDEWDARVINSPATWIGAPLTTGFEPTYKSTYMTMVKNMIDGLVDSSGLAIKDRPEYRIFMVREPQAFHEFDGTLDYPLFHFEKNEVHKEVADYFSIPLIDLWANSGINIWTRGTFLNIESGGDLMIHLNDKGYRVVADYIAKVMRQHPPLDYTGTVFGTNLGFPTATDDLTPDLPNQNN